MPAPPFQQMNLCNIHFHKNAEHKGGEFTAVASKGHGDMPRMAPRLVSSIRAS